MKNKKIIIIGIDGGTFSIIDNLIKKNKLPTIKKLIQNGVRSNLISTIQPSSEQAWSSFATGVNNGKHNIFGILKFDNKYSSRLINRSDQKGKTLWGILSEHGKKSIVINVPVTYPPEKINGLIVTGYSTPGKTCDYTYPKNLKKEIKKEVPDYVIYVTIPDVGFDDEKTLDCFLKNCFDTIEARYKLADYLFRKYEWDLSVTVFSTSDDMQHKFWSCDHTKYKTELEKMYKKLDEKINELIRGHDEDYVFLISDHGFKTLKSKLFLNAWLGKKGFLKFKKTSQKDNKFLNQFLKLSQNFKINPKQLINKWPILSRFASALLYRGIDWANTKAFAVSSGNIRINLKGRESKGCVNIEDYEEIRNDIINALKSFSDPISKEKVCKKIFKKEDIYTGPYVNDAPDIIVLFKEGYKPELVIEDKNKVFLKSNSTGNHAMEGILIAKGPNIKKGIKLNGARIIDIAPTVLNILGIPVPKEMDGKIIKKIFIQKYDKINENK